MPDRLAPLAAKLEAGDPITRADADRVARLQEIDAARQSAEFFEETLADEQEADRAIEELARAVSA